MLYATFRSPPFSCAQAARTEVNGKYKSARKKVMSDFIKELMAWMGFLNRRLESGPHKGHSKCFFPTPYLAALMKSLRRHQDFLRRHSLICR
jgi:hypothetical protein